MLLERNNNNKGCQPIRHGAHECGPEIGGTGRASPQAVFCSSHVPQCKEIIVF